MCNLPSEKLWGINYLFFFFFQLQHAQSTQWRDSGGGRGRSVEHRPSESPEGLRESERDEREREREPFTNNHNKQIKNKNSAKQFKTDPAASWPLRKSRNFEKSAPIHELISNTIKNNVLFCRLDKQQLELIVEEMYKLKVSAGHMIITQGFYLLF